MKGKHAVLLLGVLFVLTGALLLALVVGGDSSAAVVPRQAVMPIEADALPAPESDGAKVLASKCIQCHAIPDPASHTAENWPPVLRRMSGLAAARFLPALSAGQARTLEDYLLEHAQKP